MRFRTHSAPCFDLQIKHVYLTVLSIKRSQFHSNVKYSLQNSSKTNKICSFNSLLKIGRRKRDVLLRTVLDSIDIVPTDRKRTENVFTLSVLFSLQALHLWSQMRLFNCRYAVASLGSIYLPCGKFDMLSLRSSSIWYRSALTQWAYRVRQHISNASAYIEDPRKRIYIDA